MQQRARTAPAMLVPEPISITMPFRRDRVTENLKPGAGADEHVVADGDSGLAGEADGQLNDASPSEMPERSAGGE